MSDLQVASWNIRKCVGLDWRRDPRRTAGVLSGLGADVVALQEADKRLGTRAAALPGHVLSGETPYRPVRIAAHGPSLGWHGNALLVTDAVAIERAHPLHLPGLEPRGALIVDLTLHGQPWRVVSVHLGLLRHSRQLQKAAVRDSLAGLPSRPTIIAGDFNEWSDTKGFDPLRDFDIHAPGQTFHSARPVAALDRFVVSPDVDYLEGQVVRTPQTRIASDHLPILGLFRGRA